VNITERVAAAMALMRITSSGIARNNRAKRAMRVRRSNRPTRRIEALPNHLPPSLPSVISKKNVITHVSKIIIMRRHESKTNQKSCKQLRLSRKAQNRTTNSKVK